MSEFGKQTLKLSMAGSPFQMTFSRYGSSKRNLALWFQIFWLCLKLTVDMTPGFLDLQNIRHVLNEDSAFQLET